MVDTALLCQDVLKNNEIPPRKMIAIQQRRRAVMISSVLKYAGGIDKSAPHAPTCDCDRNPRGVVEIRPTGNERGEKRILPC